MIQEKVKAIISEKSGIEFLEGGSRSVTDDSLLEDDLGLDSLDVIEVIMDFEKEFEIGIPDDMMEGVTKVKDFYPVIEGLVAKKH